MHAPLPEHCDAVIIGAGLAGLAAARSLIEAGRHVIVLEASDGVGGRVRSDVVDGFTLDRGFQILLTSYPELERFDLDALQLRAFDPGALVRVGTTRLATMGDPFRRPGTLVPSALAPVGSPLDKLRLLRDRRRVEHTPARDLLRQDDASTLEALRERGYGTGIIEHFLRPLVGGIQLDGSLTSSARMFDVVLRALFTGDAAVPAHGMGAIPAQLAGNLPVDTIHLHTPAEEIGIGRVATPRGTVTADDVIVATDGPTAGRLLGVRAVESNPATCVWYAAPEPPIRHRLLVLDGTGAGPALNIAVMSNVAPEYAPDGQALIAAACPGLFDPDIEPRVRDQLRSLWGPSVDHWRVLRTDTIAHGQPRQRPGFVPKQRTSLGDGLHVCGDHRDTASIQGALYSGRRCAQAVLAAAPAR